MDDDDLIAAVAGGDDAALRELFFRHAPWLAARLRPVLPAPDVEDVLQETFLAVWRGARGYRPQASGGGAWLWGIARRQAALWHRCAGPAAAPLSEWSGGGTGDAADDAATRLDLAGRSPRSGRPTAPSTRCGGCCTSRTGPSPRSPRSPGYRQEP